MIEPDSNFLNARVPTVLEKEKLKVLVKNNFYESFAREEFTGKVHDKGKR